MTIDLEEFEDRLHSGPLSPSQEIYDQIITVGLYENYDKSMDYIAKMLENSNKTEQLAAIEALEILAYRFHKVKENLVLPTLFKNLQSEDEEILKQTIESLTQISYQIPSLKRSIYSAFFQNGLDFISQVKLKVYKDAAIFDSLSSSEEKEEFILSYCQNSLDYNEAFELCKNCLDIDDEDINISAMQGLTYLLMRFGKIEFDIILPLLKKYLASKDLQEDERYIFAESILADIAIVIPELKSQAVKILRTVESNYCSLYNL